MNNDEDAGKLIEALTLERILIPARSPGYVARDDVFDFESWGHYSRTRDGWDTVYLNTSGKRHRLYGPAYISELYDIRVWYKDGEYHREGGPAVQHKNNMYWYQEGKLHRLDGPAVITGSGPKQYWIEGRKYSPKEYKKEIERRTRKGLIK
jgi:hypothetical protein